jgi:hypothetical protein
MKKLNRYTEPQNYLNKSTKRWLICIAIYWAFIAILLLSSCSQSHWQGRGLKKGWISKDSIYLHDTIRGFDTTFIRQFDTTTLTDTFEVLKEGVKVKTVIQWKNRIVEQTITKRDTVITNVCPPAILCEDRKWWDRFTFGSAFGILIMITIIYLLRK